jgi:hypothetical protein
MNRILHVLLLGLAFSWLPVETTPTSGQDVPDPNTVAPAGGAESAENTAATRDSAEEDRSFREETIYIPYGKLPEVFEKEGRGVFIPYERFQKLWKAARQRLDHAAPDEVPVDSLIREITSEATIDERVVNVEAKLRIEIIATGWVSIPLRLNQSAVRRATIDGQPARLTYDARTGHRLLYQNREESAQTIELQLDYTRAYTKEPGQSRVQFHAPQAPINQWRIRVPEEGITVEVEPMIAATRQPVAEEDAAVASTEILAFVGAAPLVTISWNPKAEGASGLAAFATVQTEQRVTVAEGVLRTSTTLHYDISRSTMDRLVLEVPADEKVINVFDRNIKRWQVASAEGAQRIEVDLFEATQGKQSVVVELERFSDITQSEETVVPVVRAVGVGRQQGIVVARLEGELRGESTTRVGLLQLDQEDLPAPLKKQSWDFAYRFGAVPYELSLRIQKIMPRVSVGELIDAHLAANQLTLWWQGLYDIQDAGVFQLRIDVPDGFELHAVRGQAIGDAQPVVVDSHHRTAGDSPTVVVNLGQRAIGKVGLVVEMRRWLDDPNLLTPTGESSTLDIPLPQAHAADVEFSQGNVVVSAPESLRVNPATTDGLRSLSFADAYQKIQQVSRPSQLRPVLAFSFSGSDTRLSITAERRLPQVIAQQVLHCEVTSGAVKYRAYFFFDVKYSGVKGLRIDVPDALTSEIRNTNSAIRQVELSPPPDDVADGYTAWEFSGETELLGPVQVELHWEQAIDELTVGNSHTLELPSLMVKDVDRATGQIVISKSESIDIQPAGLPSGVQPIDPQEELLPQVKIPDATMAFEFVGPWQLTLTAKRYELESSKHSSIDRGLIRVVDLERDRLSIQAIYRMRSARQRILIQLPEGAEFDARPLRINGQPVTPERNSATEIFAPLLDQNLDEDFVLELRFSLPGNPSHLPIPSFPDDPAVQQVYLCAYLPPTMAMLASHGPWADEQAGSMLPWLSGSAAPDDDFLIDWVSENVANAGRSIRTFPTGKAQRLVYSTLQPGDSPDSALRLTTAHRNVLNGLIILLVLFIGLPLLGRSPRWQLAAVLMLTIVMLVLGILHPELARTVFSGVFFYAVIIMLLCWAIGALIRWTYLFRHRAGSNADSAQESELIGDDANSAEASSPGDAGSDEPPQAADKTTDDSPPDTAAQNPFGTSGEGEDDEDDEQEASRHD